MWHGRAAAFGLHPKDLDLNKAKLIGGLVLASSLQQALFSNSSKKTNCGLVIRSKLGFPG